MARAELHAYSAPHPRSLRDRNSPNPRKGCSLSTTTPNFSQLVTLVVNILWARTMFATTRVTRRSPNPKVFPPTPPLETEPLSVKQTPTQQIDELSLGVPAGQNARDSRNGASKQQSILCPYFLKNPHLLPESSICRLRDFENVEVLKSVRFYSLMSTYAHVMPQESHRTRP